MADGCSPSLSIGSPHQVAARCLSPALVPLQLQSKPGLAGPSERAFDTRGHCSVCAVSCPVMSGKRGLQKASPSCWKRETELRQIGHPGQRRLGVGLKPLLSSAAFSTRTTSACLASYLPGTSSLLFTVLHLAWGAGTVAAVSQGPVCSMLQSLQADVWTRLCVDDSHCLKGTGGHCTVSF